VAQAVTLKVGARELKLSNIDKVLFAGNGFTKAHVVDYYVRISPFVLPHLKDRPLTLKLYPDGPTGKVMYLKNAPVHTPSWVKRAPVWRRSGESQINYILVNDLPTLVWSAGLANIELHTFLARAPKIQQPTMMVFDLDPGPPADILQSAQVAIWLKQLLDDLHLQCFVKSSGSKGIHLYVPLNTPVTYELTQGFAHRIATTLEAQHPELVISEMSKAARAGKVFVDYSQNADHKTTACVYSLRAKPDGPFVSMPMDWGTLTEALARKDREVFRLRPDDALRRLAEAGDQFAPVLKLKQKLSKSLLAGLSSKTTKSKPKPPKASNDGKLKAYQAKRNFNITAEPSGNGVHMDGEKELMFVIQKHAASHLHYDFRLEMEGVLRSWAVPKGPPLVKGERRLAMHVEDHPMDYARFEGIIPKGQYGGGTVMLWDIGTYKVLDGHPVRAYHAGKLHLLLNGKKLKGEWALVRGRQWDNNGSKEPWFLIKSGADAKPISPRRDDQSVLTRRSMSRIASDKSHEWQSHR